MAFVAQSWHCSAQLCKFLWEVSSEFESIRLLARQAEKATLGWESFWERSPLDSWFSTSLFRNVHGVVPEKVHICGFRRNSSNLDSAPKMRDSVLLNSWDSFLVTLHSTSSENCAIYSSLILGTDVFHDWPFLGCSSCVSFATAANFRLFFNVAIISRENTQQWWKLKNLCFLKQFLISAKM